jgi:hypothetical protein
VRDTRGVRGPGPIGGKKGGGGWESIGVGVRVGLNVVAQHRRGGRREQRGSVPRQRRPAVAVGSGGGHLKLQGREERVKHLEIEEGATVEGAH